MASPAIDYSTLANQARNGPVDYSALADQARGNGGSPTGPTTQPGSVAGDFIKYSPVGMVKGLADALRQIGSGHNPLAGQAEQNEKILEKAKDSFHSGDYTGAAAHFLNYLVPGGQGMEDAGEDFQKGDYAHGVAKTAGIATTLAAGEKAPAALDAATDPTLPGRVADATARTGNAVRAGAKAAGPDVVAGGAKVAAGAAVTEMLPGGPIKYAVGAAPVYAGARQIGRGISKGADAFKAALSDKVAAISETSAQEAELLDGLSQSLAGKKFQALDAATQKYIRDLAATPQTRPPTPAPTPTPSPYNGAAPATNNAGTPAAQLPAAPRTFAMPGVSMEHDGSYVRAVPAEYQQKPMPGQPPPPPQQRLLGPGPMVTPPPADTSFVRGVPAQYPAAPQAQIAPPQIPDNATPQQLGTFPAPQAAAWLAKRNGVVGPYDTPKGNEFVPDAPRTPPAKSIAEQLRDEMISNGNATPDNLMLPDEHGDLKTGLRDMMRDVPQGVHKSVADANYAGDQEPKVAGAVYEAAARADKANKLADALHRGGISATDAARMDPDHWEMLSKSLGVKVPSKASIGEALFRLQRLEAAAKPTTGAIQ